MTLSLGNAQAERGKITYGEYDLVRHPVGGMDRLPVILAQGNEEGPVFWMTAGIHGRSTRRHPGHPQADHPGTGEGTARHHRCRPRVNPPGLRTLERARVLHRHRPEPPVPHWAPSRNRPGQDAPSALEQAYGRLFEEIKKSASYSLTCLYQHQFVIVCLPRPGAVPKRR